MAFKPIEILINAKDNASSVFSSLQAKVATVGAAIAAYFGVNAFVGVVQGAADLEQAMSRVQAATGASAEEMAQLKNAAEGLTDFGGAEAALALENLGKAGLSAGEAIAALGPSAALAKAGGVELGVASEALTQVIFGLGLSFKDAGRVADVLAGGANATKTSVAGLTQGLSYAAPVAKSLGLSLEYTVALLGQFAQGGIDASRAGTALNSIMSQFLDPASKFRNELSAAGITTGDFEKALRQLAAAGPAGAKAINAVGLESGPALRAMLNLGIDSLDGLVTKLRDAEGEAARTAAVMRDNLNGSVSSLSKAWEYLTNTLGTPVLPVLKDGVDQLAAAFRTAVQDGTVAKFGESIATAFRTGIQWVRDFLGTVDFNAVLARMQAFADSANETFNQVGQYATNAGNTLKLAYGVMSAGVDSVLVVVYKLGEAFANVAQRIQSGLALITEGLAKITFGDVSRRFKEAADEIRLSADATGAVAEAMAAKAAAALNSSADGARLAQEGFTGLTATTEAATTATTTWAQTVAKANEEMAAGAEAAAKAGAAYQKKAQADQAAALAAGEHQAALAQLRGEYDALIAGGQLTEAAQKLKEINDRLGETPAAAKEAAEQLEAAFKNLGMSTTKDLDDAARSTSLAWDTLTASGVKSATVLREAFTAYANAAIEAAERQGDAAVSATRRMLETKAAAAGLSLDAEKGGRVIVNAMKGARAATDELGDAANRAASGFQGMGRSAADALQNISRLKAGERNGEFSGAGAGGEFQSDKAKALADQAEKMAKQGQMLEAASLLRRAAAEDSLAKNAQRSGETRFAGVLQSDINQAIAKRYGEAMVGNRTAEEAYAARLQHESYLRNYGNGRSQQSLDQQRNYAAELQRLEGLIAAQQAGGVQGGAGAVGTTVVNINLGDGRRRSINTDSAGAQMLRELLDAKGIAG